jgi:Zn-dependent peptidase ImmA (M78 family)
LKHIKIGPINYKIKGVNKLNNESEILYGQIEYGKNVIRLNNRNKNQKNRQTLWHEAIHGILFNAGCRDEDEQLVHILASGIMEIINENPKMGKKVNG